MLNGPGFDDMSSGVGRNLSRLAHTIEFPGPRNLRSLGSAVFQQSKSTYAFISVLINRKAGILIGLLAIKIGGEANAMQ